ncbi:MAG: response regulator [Flavobacteriaceae bacterium]
MNKGRRLALRALLLLGSLFLNLVQLMAQTEDKKLSEQDSIIYHNYKFQVSKNINPNPDSAYYFIQKLKNYSSQIKYDIGLADAEYLMASYQWRLQRYDSATYYYNKCIDKSAAIDYKRGIAVGNNGLCRMYYFQGQMNEALNACESCLSVALELEDMAILPDTYIAIGNIFFRQNELKKSLTYFLKADSLHTAVGLRPEIIGAGFQSTARVYQGLEDYDKAEEYYLKANQEYLKLPIDPSYYVRTTDWHLGEVYYHKERYREADSLLSSSYSFFTEIKDQAAAAEIGIYLGLVKLEKKEYAQAENYLQSGFQLHEDMNNVYESASAALELGKLYIQQRQPGKAISYLERAMVQTKDTTRNISLITEEVLFQLAEAHHLSGDNEEAYKSLQRAMRIKDSLSTIQNIAAVTEIEEKYQNEKNEQEIALLNSEKGLIEQQRINQRNILLGGLGITSLIGIFLFFQIRNRQKTNRKLRELDSVKSNFFANISHEFRTPLTLISGPLEKRLDAKNTNETDRKEFEMMQRNSNRLLSLVDQLLDLSKLESGKYQIGVSSADLANLIKAIGESFKFRAIQQNIEYSIEVEGLNKAWFDKDVIEKILTNLLSNAFKYTEQAGSIQLSAKSLNGSLDLVVENGPTLSRPSSVEKLFDRFYQSDSHSEGVGIGLSLVKELVEIHKGAISVNQPSDKTLRFSIQIPVSKSYYSSEEIGISQGQQLKSQEPGLVDELQIDPELASDLEQEQRDIILVVEDNKDVRQLIQSTFENKYRILEAEDGDSGIEAALRYIPDLIISDIMMPGTDGLELCERLKNDERSSHIPIVLLTAKAGEEDHYKGLSTGADGYVTKPFKIKLLRARVEKLIESRKLLRDRYSQELILKPKDIAIADLDEQFLDRVQKVMETKLTESGFSVQEFSEAVGMSRMQLHRKLKALTGLSASEFVRSQRLKLAASLLRSSKAQVSEIGYQVGFNDPSYFTKCFKEAYGCSPSEYIQIKTS